MYNNYQKRRNSGYNGKVRVYRNPEIPVDMRKLADEVNAALGSKKGYTHHFKNTDMAPLVGTVLALGGMAASSLYKRNYGTRSTPIKPTRRTGRKTAIRSTYWNTRKRTIGYKKYF